MAEAQSEQSRDLSRRIRNGMLKQWAVYTAVFVMVVALFNVSLMPRFADWVAEFTSDWRMLYPASYTTQDVLDGLGFRNDDGTYDLTRLGSFEGGDVLFDDIDGGTQGAATLDFDHLNEYADLYELADSLESYEDYTLRVNETGDRAEYIVVSRSTDPSFAGSVAVDSGGNRYLYLDFATALNSPYFGRIGIEGAERALRMRDLMADVEQRVSELELRQRYAEKIALAQVPLSRDSTDWQMWWDDDDTVLSFRDLSVYNFLRELKGPIILALYFVGCAVIVLYALRRSLRSFDALSGAVGDIIANREEPVELPPDLSGVQDKLNNIRLTALADERAAVAAERRKDELVAYLAHDVKTPLTSVIGYLSLLDEAPDLPAEPREKYTRIAFEKACRLEGLIDEFFEITRYNLQAIPIERAWVQVKLFCEQVAEGFYVEAEARSLSIEVEAPEDARFFVDAEKLSRAVGNVVRNAIAYADSDTTIHLRAEAAEGESEPVWRISVTDRGREISQAHLKSIFDKFYREDGARGTKEGGTGLGLAIAQEIVVAHKGAITAESTDGTTTFTITLPCLDDPLESTP